MKDLINKKGIHTPEIGMFNRKKTNTAKIIEFRPDQNGHSILSLKIDNIYRDNYKVLLKEGHLSVILFKTVEFSMPMHVHNFKLNGINDVLNYDEQENIDFTLPNKNFYLIKHRVSPNKKLLQITLGKIYNN